MNDQYETLIVGGGPAGLSAALALGRIGRTVLVCDDRRPRNAASAHVNNFPTRDGLHPTRWREEALRDLEKYATVEFFEGSVTSLHRTGESRFQAHLSSGAFVAFRKVLLADGIEDQLPPQPGMKELWGKAVFHCPFCHGYEVRNRALGIVADGEVALHMVPLCYGLSRDLILFTHGKADLSAEQKAAFSKRGVQLVEERIQGLEYQDDVLNGVTLENGETIAREALFLGRTLPFQLKSPLGVRLGCEITPQGLYKVSEKNETSVKGIFAAGDNMDPMHSVLLACSRGATAGAHIVIDLLEEAFRD